ncbi:histidinol phosphatase [Clostridium sardiniense]|uniref:histidinol phosphatase n=1 Tax=Clostridium sardiniense TaxID=29369 RepID=UPI003D3548EB
MGKHNKYDINIFNLKDINVFYGIPNCYTSYSLGSASPNDTLNYTYRNHLDFLMVTDQNSFLTKSVSYDGHSTTRWNSSYNTCRKFSRKKDNFIALQGFEAKTIPYGDINVINSNNFFTGDIKDINLLIFWMINNPDAFIIIKRPIKSILSLPYNKVLNNMITSVEVCSGAFGERYNRREKYYFKLLDIGWKLGAINSQSTGNLDFGNYDNVTGVLLPKLSRSTLIECFRNRNTFSSESRSLSFYFFANDMLMGGIIPSNCDTIDFSILLEDKYYLIEKIEIITNGGEILHSVQDIKLNKIKYLYSHKLEDNQSWFVIKVYQEGTRIAISSPIFID